jgi:hypothetical protein
MQKFLSLWLVLALVGLLDCGTAGQQVQVSPVPVRVAAGDCVSPDGTYDCMQATLAEVPENAIWIAENSCACWRRDEAGAVAWHRQ